MITLDLPGLLEATMRHLRHERDVSVDPHATKVEGTAAAKGARVVGGPDGAGEAVAHLQ